MREWTIALRDRRVSESLPVQLRLDRIRAKLIAEGANGRGGPGALRASVPSRNVARVNAADPIGCAPAAWQRVSRRRERCCTG